MTSPSPTLRVSVPITPEVHEAFKRLASATGMSTGKAMGDWLSDTLEAVEFMAEKVQQARSAPKIVMREMHAYALGLADETGSLMERMKVQGKTDRAAASASAAPGSASRPPPSNTGGKGTKPSTGKPGVSAARPRSK